jgi:hypothetical protein
LGQVPGCYPKTCVVICEIPWSSLIRDPKSEILAIAQVRGPEIIV